MPHPALLRLAETEVEHALTQLPPSLQEAAAECTVQYEDFAEAIEADGDLDEDVLGLFEGNDRLDPLPESSYEMPRIRLFLDSLWAYVEADEQAFRQEVRVTYLHELGHYLGWDEDEIEAHGLG